MAHVPRPRTLFATTVFAAASFAALFAHVAIDVAGDTLLAHDAYDDGAHASRLSLGAIAALVTTMLLLALTWRAWREVRGERRALRQALATATGLGAGPFVAAVNVAAIAMLFAMGLADASAGGEPIGDWQVLVGGSWQLAGLLTSGIATLLGGLTYATLRWTGRRSVAIVAALAAAIERLVAVPRVVPLVTTRARHALAISRLLPIGRNTETRGPPLRA